MLCPRKFILYSFSLFKRSGLKHSALKFWDFGRKVDDLRHSLKQDGLKRQALPNFIYAVIQINSCDTGMCFCIQDKDHIASCLERNAAKQYIIYSNIK